MLGYDEVGGEELIDAHRRGPSFWFQQMSAERSQRNRIHIDVYVPHDQAEARIAAALTAGGRIVSDANDPGGGPSPTPRATRQTWRSGDSSERRG